MTSAKPAPLNSEDRGQLIGNSQILEHILQGHDLSNIKLPAKEEIPDLKTLTTTLSITLLDDELSITRYLVKPFSCDWNKLNPEVSDLFKKAEKACDLEIKLVDDLRILNDRLADCLAKSESAPGDEAIVEKILDIETEIAEKTDELEGCKNFLMTIKDLVFQVIEKYHPEIYDNLFQIFVNDHGVAELWLTELVRDNIMTIPRDLSNCLKNYICSLK
jgi:hypothetical protein